MRSSIIIAAYNEGKLLDLTLQSTFETTGNRDCEIIVVDDGSTDGSVASVKRKYPPVRVLALPERTGPAASKDLGAREARGQTLIFLDGHTKPERAAIERLVVSVESQQGQAIILPRILRLNADRWQNERPSTTFGYSIDLKTFQTDWKPIQELKPAPDAPGLYESPSLIGCAFAIDRGLYETLWGQDTGMRGWGVEDIDLGLKSWLFGHPILLDPTAFIGHRFRAKFDNYRVSMPQVVANQLRMARKNLTDSMWSTWVQAARVRFSAGTAEHPEGIWTRAWLLFEQDRASVEEERAYLLGRRKHDEFWFSEYFGLDWPRLDGNLLGPLGNSTAAILAADARLLPREAPGDSPTATSAELALQSPAHTAGGQPASFSLPWTNTGTSSGMTGATLTSFDVDPSPSPPIPFATYRPPCDPVCPTCRNGVNGSPCAPDSSSKPVRYATGEIQLSATDLLSSGFGSQLMHRRVYSNVFAGNQQVGQGAGWLVFNWPYLEIAYDEVNPPLFYQYVRGTEGTLWFFPNGSAYTCGFGGQAIFTSGADPDTCRIIQPSGYYQEFYDYRAGALRGLFIRQVEAGGQVTEVTSRTGRFINEIQRTTTVDGVTTVESIQYVYASGLVTSATLRRQVDGGAWTYVRRAAYSYYTIGDSSGSVGDLKLVQIQLFDGTNWVTYENTHYRYYLSIAGFGDGLKFVVQPGNYQAMVADGLDPLTASDSQIMLYSDYYFEYDSGGHGRVTRESVYRGSQTFDYAYTDGHQVEDYNVWLMKTVETLPDGNQNVVYTNWIGQMLVKAFVSGADQWVEVWQYDENGREALYATPAAVAGYNEGSSDLGITFHASAGQIRKTTYDTDSGNQASVTLQQGSGGTPITQMSATYTSVTSPYGKIFPLTTQTAYRNTDGTGTIEASFSSTYYSGSVQQQLQTTVLPAISTSQNGSGSSNSNQTYYDQWGNPTWMRDERGYITNKSYDIATGALIQQIDDVDTSIVSGAPAGWSTPLDGGLNLVTDFEIDDLGRTTQILGPSHEIDLGGVATTIRTATWFVYQDTTYQTWMAAGYATGTGPSYSFTLVNPVSVTITDADGRVQEQIAATRGSDVTSSGRLSPTDSFSQTSYVRWTTTQYLDCCFVASQRVYHLIPASGTGSSGTNYDETNFGYDVMKRRYRTVTPGGTITDLVYEARGLVVGSWVGTNDASATPTDPSGGGAAGNNMVQISGSQYDGGAAGGNGNLTQLTQYVDASTTRVAVMTYDFRDRLVTTDGEIDYFAKNDYDNLSQVIRRERYDTTASGHLIGRSETNYDDSGRVYQSIVYGVDPSTGTVGHSLTDNFWYDASGNLIKQFPSGSQLFLKTTYDSLGRPVIQYAAYGPDSTYADAFSVLHNVVLQQVESAYDADSNKIQGTMRQRYHNSPAVQTGTLGTPSTTPNARVSYVAMYPDGVGRTVNTANFGTNAGTALTRPTTAPSRSDTILVNSAAYDPSGQVTTTTDPAGMIVCYAYDDAGRVTSTTENCVSSSSSSSSSSTSPISCAASDDTNRVTRFTYTPDGQQATLVAENSRTGNQTTTYTYGTTLSDSRVATSTLLRYIDYPDSSSGSDRVSLGYNRQAERTFFQDQRGCIHQYNYDQLARLTDDRVTSAGAGVDTAVLRLSTGYEVRGLPALLTSYDNATVGSGNIVNQVGLTYNSFGQIVADAQSHDGAVSGSTPKVQYGYTDGSTNMIRPTSLTYPNGRVITTSYGTTDDIDNVASRVHSLIDGSTTLVQYSYLGLDQAVQVTYPEPSIQHTLLGSSSGTSPAGDIYWGLDLFSRIIDSRWFNTGTSTDVDRIKYGYDRASNRIWRQNPVATAAGAQFDEYYTNDGLQRLKDMQRGTLNGTQTGITSPTFEQCWTLDATGNWRGFNESTNGSTWTLQETRTANSVNEITAILAAGSSAPSPSYDAAGNMTLIPTSTAASTPTTGWNELSVDDWSGLSLDAWNTLPVSTSELTGSLNATYDAWNRLVTVTEATDGTPLQRSQYDARTFRMVTQSYTSGSLSETRHSYFSAQWTCLEERIGASTAPERHFIYGGRYIDDIILRDRASERLYPLQDAHFNVTSIVDPTGSIQERYQYLAYGGELYMTPSFGIRPNTLYDWDTLFASYRRDSATGIYCVRNRCYSTAIGTWHQRDPLGIVADTNHYALCSSQPLVATDPTGLYDVLPLGPGAPLPGWKTWTYNNTTYQIAPHLAQSWQDATKRGFWGELGSYYNPWSSSPDSIAKEIDRQIRAYERLHPRQNENRDPRATLLEQRADKLSSDLEAVEKTSRPIELALAVAPLAGYAGKAFRALRGLGGCKAARAKGLFYSEEALLSAPKGASRPNVAFDYVDDLLAREGAYGQYIPGKGIEIQSQMSELMELGVLRHEYGHSMLSRYSLGASDKIYFWLNTAEVAEEFAVHFYATKNIAKAVQLSYRYVNVVRLGVEGVIGGSGAGAAAWYFWRNK